MAKINLGRVRYPVEASVKPGSCWPVSGAAVYNYIESFREQLIQAVENSGTGKSTSKKGWFIKFIDDTNWNYSAGTGTVDIYVSLAQSKLSDLTSSEATAASAYDAGFGTGWEGFVGSATKLGHMVVIRNNQTFCDCGVLKAVDGNKITIQGNGTKFLNSTLISGTDKHVKVFFTDVHQTGNAAGKTPGETDDNLAGEWSIALSRSQDIITGASSMVEVGDVICASSNMASGIDAIATGQQAVALGEHTVASGNNATAIGTGIYNPMSHSVVVGNWNAIPGTTPYPFAVGIGTGANDRKDGFRVNNNGSLYVAKVATLTPVKSTDTLAQVTAKMRALTAALCSRPDGTSTITDDDTGDHPHSVFVPALGESAGINAVVYGSVNNTLVAATDSGLYYSKDGVTFTRAESAGQTGYTGVVWDPFHVAGKGSFIACGETGIRYSEDGVTWNTARITDEHGALHDSTTAETGLRVQVYGSPYVFCGGRISVDGGQTWTYSGSSTTPGAFWKDVAGDVQHFEIVAGTAGRIAFYNGSHSVAYPVTGLETGYTNIVAMDDIGIGKYAAKNLLLAIANDDQVEVKYTMVDDGNGSEWKSCNAPHEAYIGGRIYDAGHGIHHVVLVTRSNGVYVAEEFAGTETVWKHVSNMQDGNYNVPSAKNNCLDMTVIFTTASGGKDSLLVSTDGKAWARVHNFTIDAQPPVQCFGCKLAFIANNKKDMVIVAMSEIKDGVIEAANRATEDSSGDSDRYLRELDAGTEGLAAVVDHINYVSAKLNWVIDKLNL